MIEMEERLKEMTAALEQYKSGNAEYAELVDLQALESEYEK
jgi:hypothetical protein